AISLAAFQALSQNAEIRDRFTTIFADDSESNLSEQSKSNKYNGYRGESISPDLKELLVSNPEKRLNLVLQAKDATSPELRRLLVSG
ncbi:hypothetical protein OFD18_33320, partial [Escherichia coli]|nr:hypothetical protein [Escherichia coli]